MDDLSASDADKGEVEKAASFIERARQHIKKAGPLIASIAAIGAVASGFVGYWNVWKTVKTAIYPDVQSVQKEAVAKPHVAPRLSLVVLPFANLNHEPEQDYFAEGITTDLTTDLGRMPAAFVIGRGTAFAYKNKQIDPRALGKELAVRWAVQGAVQRNGDQVRINVALTDLSTGGNVWSDRFDGDRANLAALQDQITARLARSLNVGLMQAEGRRVESERGRNLDAMDFIMRGSAKAFEQPRSRETLAEARKLFEDALRLDPNNVDAAVWVANMINSAVASGYSRARDDDLNISKKMVELALSKRPNNAMAHAVKGETLRLSGKPEDALPEYNIALGIDPNYPITYIDKGAALIYAGRSREAIAPLQTAIRLSPKDPIAFAMHYFLCDAFAHLGEYVHAIAECRQSIALNPKFGYVWGPLAASYALSDNLDKAREIITNFRRSNPSWTNKNVIQNLRVLTSNEQFWREFNVLLDGYRKAGVPDE